MFMLKVKKTPSFNNEGVFLYLNFIQILPIYLDFVISHSYILWGTTQ